MSHISYEQSKKDVYRGLLLLGFITLVEVAISLLATGHVGGWEPSIYVRIPLLLIIGALSIYKAYFIIFDFMHMKHEVGGLSVTVLLPVTLLIWAIIAFFQEGSAFGSRRVNYGNTEGVNPTKKSKSEGKPTGQLLHPLDRVDTYKLG